jgi:hypothetical protein
MARTRKWLDHGEGLEIKIIALFMQVYNLSTSLDKFCKNNSFNLWDRKHISDTDLPFKKPHDDTMQYITQQMVIYIKHLPSITEAL